MAVHPQIQEILDRDTGRPALANNHLKTVIELLEANAETITPAVFNQLMVDAAAELKLEHTDRVKDLKTVFKLRELISKFLAGAAAATTPAATPAVVTATPTPAAPAAKAAAKDAVKSVEAAVVTPVSSGGFDLGDPLPEASGNFKSTNPEDTGNVIEVEAETVVAAPPLTRLATANKSPVLSKAPATAAPAAPVTPMIPDDDIEDTDGMGVDVAQLIQLPNTDAPVEMLDNPVEPPQDQTPLEGENPPDDGRGLDEAEKADTTAGSPSGFSGVESGIPDTSSALPKPAAKKGKGGTVVGDIDALMSQLADQVLALQKENQALRAELESLKQESSNAKLSPATRKKLESLGINV